jgi:uncharacterized protein with FMN-binding domain
MKRVLFSLAATVAGLVALLDFKTHNHPLPAAGGLPSVASSSSTATSPSTTRPPVASPSGSPSSAGSAAKYTGAAIQTRYGVVQVAVTITGRHIDAASFVRLDAFDHHSQDINSYAAPILLRETIKAQSAHIDSVSGATYTSNGYAQSLQSALDRAGIR